MPDSSPGPDARSARPHATGVPGWVKVFAVIAVLAIIAFAVLHLTGNGLGGPGSHGIP